MTAKIIKVEEKVCGVFIPLTKRFYFRNNANLAIQFSGLFSSPTLYVSGIITV